MQYKKTDEIRFWSKVNVGRNNKSCWNWKASNHKFGYGWFRLNKKTYLAHRLSLIFFNDGKELGLQVNHKCGNPMCCNPYHLYWGTQKENIRDSINDGTHVPPPKNNIMPPIRYGKDNKSSKLNKNEVDLLRKDRFVGKSAKYLSKKYNIAISTVYQIINYKTWK